MVCRTRADVARRIRRVRLRSLLSAPLRTRCVRLVLPALLDETAQPHVELVLGIPFDQVLQLWAALCLEQVRLADDAFRLLATLDL